MEFGTRFISLTRKRQRRWLLFVDQESVRLSLYALCYFDLHLFAAYNMRPMMSPIEFEWELPADSELWEAKSATEWWQVMLQKELETGGGVSLEDQAQVKSLLVASQSLLSSAYFHLGLA